MNWFERYGIPGLYFSSYIFLCVFSSHFDIGIVPKNENIELLLTILAGLSLPAGYILSIFSQLLYYKILCCYHIHRYALDSNKPEETLEGQMVKIFRIDLHVDNVDKCRWVSEWISKRVDVVAINNSVLFATIIGYALCNILHKQIFQADLPHTKLILMISSIIAAVLIWNTCLLVKQIKMFTKSLYKSKDSFLNEKTGKHNT